MPRNGTAMTYKNRKRNIELTRRVVQVAMLLLILWIGAAFAVWVFGLEAGEVVGERPPGVEGFLPISSLITLRHWILTGTAATVHPAGLVLLLLILGTGLLLKKAFCSWICPVGAISEALAAASRRVFGRKIALPPWLDYALRGTKYLLLAYFLFAVFYLMSPEAIEKFLYSPYNKMSDVKMLLFFARPSLTTAVVMGILVALSFAVPYFWCRYLCPYGALLGALSWLSPLKIRRDPEKCNSCGSCTQACPAHIKVDSLLTVRSDECIGCLSCVAACPISEAVAMEAPRRRRVRPVVFAALVVVLFFGGIGVAKAIGYWRGDMTTAEYHVRLKEIDSPKYHHQRGNVPNYAPGD